MNKTLIASDMNCGIGNYHVAVMRQVILSPVHLYFCKMKEIKLTQGKVALVDDEDYDELMKHKWCAHKMGEMYYADRGKYENGKQRTILMHRQILGITEYSIQVDHINMNGLDNRRCNIRACTRSQNFMNQKSYKNSSSKYKGVEWRKDTKKWRARIRMDKKLYHIGCFENEIDAAKAYDEFAKKMFGEFARTNF